jgi:hypothetical protein
MFDVEIDDLRDEVEPLRGRVDELYALLRWPQENISWADYRAQQRGDDASSTKAVEPAAVNSLLQHTGSFECDEQTFLQYGHLRVTVGTKHDVVRCDECSRLWGKNGSGRHGAKGEEEGFYWFICPEGCNKDVEARVVAVARFNVDALRSAPGPGKVS